MNGLGGESNEVALIADELSRAVELTLNPSVAHEARSQAYNACESFKENSPWCAQAGLLLATSNQHSAVVKHFGLQLMEHTVKYRWTQISQGEKIFIKENAMKLLYMGGWETGHLNDALARVIVEMVKREWPQQWPTLLGELSDACTRGHVHTQIVLHVFLRLVEDVATLQTLEQHQRRKDIYQALTSNMAEIFTFFMRLIDQHVQQFRELSVADPAAAASHGRVVQVVLLTLTGFVEWVSISHVVAGDGRLLQMLCVLLADEVFRLPAAECLLQIVNRKGSTKERRPLMILFSAEAVACLHRAVLSPIAVVGENNYLFLKKLSQVIAGLGQQLTSMWTYAQNCEAWLPVLLETMLLMTSHPSLTLAHNVNSVWLALFKLEQRALLGKMPSFPAVIPRWLQASAQKVFKVTYPLRAGASLADAAAYAAIDYDSEQEFTIFFCRCRNEILESFRYCMCVSPQLTWLFAEQWARSALAKGDSCPPDLEATHPLYLEWEALSLVLDVVLSRLLVSEPRPDAGSGLQLLQSCVNCSPAAAALQSLLLSLISALFVFLSCACSQLAGPQVGSAGAELLPRVLDKIFAALMGGGDAPRSKHEKNTRRHAVSLLVKLASKYPLLLLPVFGRLHGMARTALSRTDLSTVESVTLQESLLLVSNHLCCFERQSALVAEVLGDCSTRWAELGPHLTSGESLARLIGLSEPPNSAEDERASARRALLHALTLLLGVVKRTQVPDDPDKASRGGFSGGVTPSGNPVWRNPCAAHVLPLLPHVLSLCRALHELHSPRAASWRHPGHARALCIPLAEQQQLLGLRDHDATASGPEERMQNFLYTLHDSACHLLGSAASSLGRELYSMPGLSDALIGSLLGCMEPLPDHWLRPIIRSAIKPLVHHCPPAHCRPVIAPIVQHLSIFMLEHLSRRWDYVDSLISSGRLEEAGADAREVLDDMLVRNLTREYLEVLKISLVGGGLITPSECSGDMEEDAPAATGRAPEQLSEMGGMLLGQAPAMLHTIFRALTWNDSMASLRACALVMPSLRSFLDSNRLTPGEANGALAAVLAALRQHGQHDNNQQALLTTAVQMYEALRPQFPAILTVMRAIPDVDAHDLHRLDEKLSAARGRPAKTDKSKRELFKKITSRLIGRNVGQLFKKEVFIMDLPTMPAAAKDKPRAVVDSPEGANLEGLFASHVPT